MANLYMRIGENKVEGAATLDLEGSPNNTLFAVSSVHWGANRSVNMDPGNTVNADAGEIMLDTIGVHRNYDGASELILSRFYRPNKEPEDIEIIYVKQYDNTNKRFLQVKLIGGRICHYHTELQDGSYPVESFGIYYTEVETQFWHSDPKDGSIKAGGMVGYNMDNKTVTAAMK
ncbi:MAG: type VI secretion system tube protein Hcp [Endozoicomonas sp. (ex Botrylloides leachii)]|nr:type VI secretion system tube protein Hcp [Endozoicomonas sp. (ex Botrylloides leachii)]